MGDSIFTKIIKGQIPCHKVYEDDHVVAFLDVNPLSRGHTLLVPKEPAETLDKLSDESASAIGRVLPKLCRAVVKATGAPAFNVLQNNGSLAHQAVFHVHFHIIPRFEEGSPSAKGGAGLGIRWDSTRLEGAETLASSIQSHLSTT